ncbi:MAG: DUF5320 domain-containing protein [Actinobacteria bacterium]|nr:DUF5320 domain-containing protein [Actinomycetota bacterium]
MPRGDGTGPMGLGPMTGRAAGYCAGYPVPGFMNPYGGRFFGAGGRLYAGAFGRGRGFRNWYWATGLPGWYRYGIGLPAWGGAVRPPLYPPYVYAGAPFSPPFSGSAPGIDVEQEKNILKEQADFLKQQLGEIEKRLSELEKEEKEAKE